MMKLTFSLAFVGAASTFVEPSLGDGVRALAHLASNRNDMVTQEIPTLRTVVSGKYVGTKWVAGDAKARVTDLLNTRVPPPSGLGNATPMPLADGPVERRALQRSTALPFVPCC